MYCCQIIWSFLGSSSWTGVSALTSPRTIDCPHQYHRLPRSILVVFKFLAYSCHCSVDTELIDRKYNAINCILIGGEVYRQFFLVLYFSIDPWTMELLHGRWDVRFLRIVATCLQQYGPRLLVDYSREGYHFFLRTWSNKWPLTNTKSPSKCFHNVSIP